MKPHTGFGLAPIREEGAPLNPYDAAMFSGPGATEKWFNKQCVAYFNFRRQRGDTEQELQSQYPEYYIAPEI